jgi:hypothetical protein
MVRICLLSKDSWSRFFAMSTPDAIQEARRQGIGATLLLLAASEPARAYYILKQLGLSISDLQRAGFTEIDLLPLKRGWREVQRRIEKCAVREPNISAPSDMRH